MLRLLALFMVPAVWGVGFLATRWGLQGLGPFWLTEGRFLLAALLAAPFFPWKQFKEWPAALVAAAMLLTGMLLQTIGLAHTTVAKNAFLTALYAMFIPAIGAAFLKHRIRALDWGMLAAALFGVALMCELSMDALNLGDWLTLACAVVFALHILWLDRCARRTKDVLQFGLAQVIGVGALGLPVALVAEGLPIWSGTSALPVIGLLYLTLLSTLFSFVLQIWVQSKFVPHVAGLVFLLESPIAAVAALAILGEAMTPAGFAGSLLISICAVVLVRRSREVSQPAPETPVLSAS
ncbi:DMT family transporter [bacterium]|nr:DMT family transporter [bacterium]